MNPTLALTTIVKHLAKTGVQVYDSPTLKSHEWNKLKGIWSITATSKSDDAEKEESYILDTPDVYAWTMANRFYITRGTTEQVIKIHSFLNLIK